MSGFRNPYINLLYYIASQYNKNTDSRNEILRFAGFGRFLHGSACLTSSLFLLFRRDQARFQAKKVKTVYRNARLDLVFISMFSSGGAPPGQKSAAGRRSAVRM